MKQQKLWFAALAVTSGLMIANSVQAQGITGTTYLSNVTPNNTAPNALYRGMSTATFTPGANGLTIATTGEGDFFYVLLAGQVVTYGALANPEVVVTFTMNGGSAVGDYVGSTFSFGDNNGTSATYGGYSGPGNAGTSPNTVWTGNTAVTTIALTGALATSMAAGGDAIYSFSYDFDPTTLGSYNMTLNSITFQASPVPEPTSLALVGLGAAGLLTFRRRK